MAYTVRTTSDYLKDRTLTTDHRDLAILAAESLLASDQQRDERQLQQIEVENAHGVVVWATYMTSAEIKVAILRDNAAATINAHNRSRRQRQKQIDKGIKSMNARRWPNIKQVSDTTADEHAAFNIDSESYR